MTLSRFATLLSAVGHPAAWQHLGRDGYACLVCNPP
jgi:hypothetical protein